jgi:hypothetical protein
VCPGNSGRWSRNATVVSDSATIAASTSPLTIRQKRQSLARTDLDRYSGEV